MCDARLAQDAGDGQWGGSHRHLRSALEAPSFVSTTTPLSSTCSISLGPPAFSLSLSPVLPSLPCLWPARFSCLSLWLCLAFVWVSESTHLVSVLAGLGFSQGSGVPGWVPMQGSHGRTDLGAGDTRGRAFTCSEVGWRLRCVWPWGAHRSAWTPPSLPWVPVEPELT